MVRKTGPPTRAAQRGQPQTAGAAVEIHAQARPETAYREPTGRKDLGNLRMVFEDGGKTRLDHHPNLQIGPSLLEQADGRRGEDAIAQGTETDDANVRATRKLLETRPSI